MTISELLDAAKRKQKTLGRVAELLGIEQQRLSKWRAGQRKPDAAEIMMLAEMAGLPPFETLAKIELEIDSTHRSIWERALGTLRAAGVTATFILGILAFSSLAPKQASANTVDHCLHTAGVAGSNPAPPTKTGEAPLATRQTVVLAGIYCGTAGAELESASQMKKPCFRAGLFF